MASSNLSPPTRTEPLYTIPPSEITPTSVVPPPMSTTMEPVASDTGKPAPMAAAMGSSIRYTCDAPAPGAASLMARRSTWVDPHGTEMMMRGEGENIRDSCAVLMNCLIICSVTVKSAITPSFMGRIASMLPGTLPSICFASDGLNGFLAIRTAFLADGNHRWLVKDDALAPHVDQRVGGAKINRQIV